MALVTAVKKGAVLAIFLPRAGYILVSASGVSFCGGMQCIG